MNKSELEHNIRICALDLGIDEKFVRPIQKDKLIIDKEYFGNCRNSDKAIWKGNYFEYKRYKFGSYYIDKINHYEDDDGYDVFVPVEVVRETKN